MYFTMLKTVFDPDSRYYVYIDIKDTLGHEKVEKLQDILCTNAYDFSRKMIADVKRVHSHEVEHLQVADLLIGALSYLHRELSGNSAKEALIARIRQRSGYRLTLNTMMRELKFNLLIWSSRI
jgi:NADH:ubiquinone oxidoreductase subunit D